MTEPLLDVGNNTVLYDTVNSYYAGIVRNAMCENGMDFVSHYVNMQASENLQPWYIRLNPKGTVPTVTTSEGSVINESRDIVNWAYGSAESAQEKEVFDQLYSECPGSLAWLIGETKIPLLKVVVKSPMKDIMLPKIIKKLQKENPDLHEVYEKKLAAMSVKHFSKKIEDVQGRIQGVVDFLDGKRKANSGPWLLGSDFGRADALTAAYLQWIMRCNEYNAAPIIISQGMLEFLDRAKSRPAFQKAIGQYGEDGFVLSMFRKKNRIAGGVLAALVIVGLVFLLR